MKSIKLILLLLVSCAALLNGADLASVHTVYVLPMAHGLEQFLANCLTSDHVFVIVTDPKLADAVLTEKVGAALQLKLDTMLATPPPETPKTEEKDKDAALISNSNNPFTAAPVNKMDNPSVNSSVGNGRGTIFLVDTKSRQVVWSVYELPKDSTPKEMDRIASVIVSRLKKSMGLKK